MAQLLLLLGILVALLLGLKAVLRVFHLPPVSGYLVVGWLLRLIGEQLGLITPRLETALLVLANIGISLLLFHVGLETHLKRLTRYLGRAGIVAASNIAVSGLLGFLTAYFFGLSLAASLFVGTALTATSIAIATGAWPDAEPTATPRRSILLDLVIIDDIVAILLMALLFSLIPFDQLDGALVWKDLGLFALKFAGLILLCYLFARFVEPTLVKEVIKYERMPDSMLTVLGLGLIIASIAALLGFSFALGAFFAGIAFSRDPRAVRMDASMLTVRDLFVPFFFFFIGFQASLISLEGAWLFAIFLLLAAVAGKFLGTWIPGMLVGLSSSDAALVGLATIPRASIALVIIERGLEIGVVPEVAYTAIVLISLITCIATPLLLRRATT